MLIVFSRRSLGVQIAMMSHSPTDEMKSGKDGDGHERKHTEHSYPTGRMLMPAKARVHIASESRV
jgi:hypothetical protein